MSDVKSYDPIDKRKRYVPELMMHVKSGEGDYVKYEDYEKLQKKNADLKEEINRRDLIHKGLVEILFGEKVRSALIYCQS